MAKDMQCLTLYGRLTDKFGDNGLVSVLVARVARGTVEIDLWLMSCRVLKWEMELAMFDMLVEQCQARGIRRIVGVYVPTKKNAMVEGLYRELEFTSAEEPAGQRQVWLFEVPREYAAKSSHILRTSPTESVASASLRAQLERYWESGKCSVIDRLSKSWYESLFLTTLRAARCMGFHKKVAADRPS
jgi:hypothetical protein